MTLRNVFEITIIPAHESGQKNVKGHEDNNLYIKKQKQTNKKPKKQEDIFNNCQ